MPSPPSGPFRAHGRAPPACRCGHGRAHPMVSPLAEYSFIGWCFILIGCSWEPRSITFTCRVCEQPVEKVDDPREMKGIRLAG